MAFVDPEVALEDAVKHYNRPATDSHKGQNGRLLVIGGSKLFHAPMIWAAAAASRINDFVHFASTSENNKVFTQIKSLFIDGIVVEQKELLNYVDEDDCILIGPGVPRGNISDHLKEEALLFNDIRYIEPEWDKYYALIHFLIDKYPHKKFVFDAGALQIMDKRWLLKLETPPLITPHVREFDRLFGIDLSHSNEDEKTRILIDTAKKFNCTIMLKNITDYVTDGERFVKIVGGNAGLSKGGSGDIIGGIASALFTKNDGMDSLILASYIVNTTAEDLYTEKGLMYNSTDLVLNFSKVGHRLLG